LLFDNNFGKCGPLFKILSPDRPVHREFCYESPGERILKIGPHLPKLLTNIKGLTFLEHGIYVGGTASKPGGITPWGSE